MKNTRPIHSDFQKYLTLKDQPLTDLFSDLRDHVFEVCPEANELLYHTHALTALFSLSRKMSDAFCMIPIYSNHLNLGFNRGTLLDDPHNLLQGTGKLIRHIPITKPEDFQDPRVTTLIRKAIDFAREDLDGPIKDKSMTISKIK